MPSSDQSGNVSRTPDKILSDTENLTNAKVNQAASGSWRIDANAVGPRELASGVGGGFDTVAELRASTEDQTDGARVDVEGWHVASNGDFGPPLYVDLGDTSTADDGLECFVDGSGVRFKRELNHWVEPEWAGAKGNGSTDDSTALQTCIDWAESQKASAARGGIIRLGAKRYATTRPLVIDDEGVTMEGTGTRFFSLSLTSSILGNHTNGPIIHVKASSTRLKGFRVDSRGARLPTSPYGTSQDYSNPAIGSGATRNDGIHCVTTNNGANSAERVNYIVIDGIHVRGQPGSGLVLCGNSVGCSVRDSVFEYNNSHNIYIGTGELIGHTFTSPNRVGLGEIENCRTSDAGGNNLILGDIATSRVHQPYRWRISNHESFRSGHNGSNQVQDGNGGALDYDVILIGENLEYRYSATQGRSTGSDGDGNGLLVGGRNIRVINCRFIDCYRPFYIGEAGKTSGIFKKSMLNTEGVTIKNPFFNANAGSIPRGVRYDTSVYGVDIRAPYTSGVDLMYDNEVTISAGSADVPFVYPYNISLDTEGNAASDSLSSIGQGKRGDILVLTQNSTARVITVQHNGGEGSSNIRLASGTGFTFGGTQDQLMLIVNAESPQRWVELSRTVI